MSENRETQGKLAAIVASMDLDHNACYEVVSARDRRFDGHFFTAVKTTGIYCRPICPATTPKRQNVTFYPTAAAAGEAGYRPCLRCRPEATPDVGAWRGSSNTVNRALAFIEDGALDDMGDVAALAERVGVGERVASCRSAIQARSSCEAVAARNLPTNGRSRARFRLRQHPQIQ
jgi:AraC family transcriptional regulator of adaptative response / DNA-3-methyladenine glycosylase II